MPSGTKGGKAKKRRIVAAGAIAGKTTRRIAKEADCSPRHVTRLVQEPETQFLISETLRPFQRKLAMMAAAAIRAVERGFVAKRTDRSDHIAQLRAVERYGDLLELAAGDTRSAGRAGDGVHVMVTWTQFMSIKEEREAA